MDKYKKESTELAITFAVIVAILGLVGVCVVEFAHMVGGLIS